MFDYPMWQKWLEAKGNELRAIGLDEVRLSFNHVGTKPSMGLGLVGQRTMGLLEVWITGEADYTITDMKAVMVSHKWGVIVDDHTFETLFQEFMTSFQHQETSN
jgi:hypothetical protein